MEICVICGELKLIRQLRIHQPMDEVTASLRPYQIGTCTQSPVTTLSCEGAVLRQALSGIVGIQQILTRLHVLDAFLAEQAVEVMPRHVKLLPYLGNGEARDAVQHMVGILRTRLQLGDLFVTSLQGGLHDLKRTGQDDFIAVVRTNHHVSSLLADAWKDFVGHPMLEPLGAIELVGKDEGIEAGLVDEDHHLVSAVGGGTAFHRILRFDVHSYGIIRSSVP